MPLASLFLVMISALAALTSSPGSPVQSASQHDSTCPVDLARARTLLTHFLVSPTFAEDRDSVSLTAADTAAVRVLSDVTDAATCSTLQQLIVLPTDAPRVWVAYQIRNRYVIATYITGGIHLQPTPLVVLDSVLQPLRAVGM